MFEKRLLHSVFKVSFCLSVSIFLFSCTFGERSGIGPGDSAPSFNLHDLDGVSHKLTEYRGKVVLINFWASWCAPCVAEMPALERLYRRLKDQGFEIVAVGVDDEVSNLKEFQKQFDLSFPVLFDKGNKIKAQYNVRGVPESFVLDKSGKFIMIPDLDDNQPVVRIVGPREWDSPNAVARFKKLLED